MRGHFSNIPNQPQSLHAPQQVIGDIDFPPIKALAGGGGIVVVIIVPPFAESNQRQEQIVLAVVASLIALRPIDVRQRVDRTGAVE